MPHSRGVSILPQFEQSRKSKKNDSCNNALAPPRSPSREICGVRQQYPAFVGRRSAGEQASTPAAFAEARLNQFVPGVAHAMRGERSAAGASFGARRNCVSLGG